MLLLLRVLVTPSCRYTVQWSQTNIIEVLGDAPTPQTAECRVHNTGYSLSQKRKLYIKEEVCQNSYHKATSLSLCLSVCLSVCLSLCLCLLH